MIEWQNGSSLRSIARRLVRSAATIGRELQRGSDGSRYHAGRASEAYRQRRTRSCKRRKLEEGTALHRYVCDRWMYQRWSPEQIAAKLKGMSSEACPGLVSHETIYAALYAHPRGALKQGLIHALRQGKATRGRPTHGNGWGNLSLCP